MGVSAHETHTMYQPQSLKIKIYLYNLANLEYVYIESSRPKVQFFLFNMHNASQLTPL